MTAINRASAPTASRPEVRDDEALSLPTVEVASTLLRRDGTAEPRTEPIAAEVPVAMVYNGLSHAVMMASPTELEDLALGFSLSEGIAESKLEVTEIEIAAMGEGVEARLTVSSRAFFRLKEHRRAMAGRTGCGLCGVESLDQALRELPKLSSGLQVSTAAIHRALDALPAHQVANRVVRSLHAAAFCSPEGELLAVREDVGRHNAFDKLVGALAAKDIAGGSGFAVITSRCSFEMAQKAISAGIPVLAAVSSPTHLAVKLAKTYDLTLLALARSDSMTLFTGRHRIQP